MNTFSDIPSVQVLERLGLPYAVRTYTYHDQGGTPDAAAQLKIDEHRILKTLVFANGRGGSEDGEPAGVVVLMHGDNLVSVRKLESASGVRHLVPASFDEAIALTGLTPGGIGPFALRGDLPLYAQASVADLKEVVVNAGVRGVVLLVQPKALDSVNVRYANLTRG